MGLSRLLGRIERSRRVGGVEKAILCALNFAIWRGFDELRSWFVEVGGGGLLLFFYFGDSGVPKTSGGYPPVVKP